MCTQCNSTFPRCGQNYRRVCRSGIAGNVRERDVADLNLLVGPLRTVSLCTSKVSPSPARRTHLVEQLDAANLLGDLLGEHGVASRALDLDFAVRHDCGC
jgi:hypothetical protein